MKVLNIVEMCICLRLLVLPRLHGLIGNVLFLESLDELDGFEEAWKGTAQKHFPGWSGNFSGLESAGTSFPRLHHILLCF